MATKTFKSGMVDASIIGDKALVETLKSLRSSATNQVMRPAIRKGLEPIFWAVAARTDDTFRPYVSTRVRTSRRTKSVYGSVEIGPLNGSDWSGRTIRVDGRDVPITVAARFVEFGHGGPHPAPAHPFVRPAVAASRDRAVAAITAKARSQLDKATMRAFRKGKTFGE